jgi:hypothetical protein
MFGRDEAFTGRTTSASKTSVSGRSVMRALGLKVTDVNHLKIFN